MDADKGGDASIRTPGPRRTRHGTIRAISGSQDLRVGQDSRGGRSFTALCREAELGPTFTSGFTRRATDGCTGPFTGLLTAMA